MEMREGWDFFIQYLGIIIVTFFLSAPSLIQKQLMQSRVFNTNVLMLYV